MGEENWIKNIVRTQDYNKGKFQQATSSILMIKIEYQTTKKKRSNETDLIHKQKYNLNKTFWPTTEMAKWEIMLPSSKYTI